MKEKQTNPQKKFILFCYIIKNKLTNNIEHLRDGQSNQNKNHTVRKVLMNICDKGPFETVTH